MGNSGSGGLLGFVAGTLMVAVVISLVTGTHAHWLFVLGAIVVGLVATRSIRN